ncbi:MAG: hypothetical protein JXB10_00920 [Pirellulales bacterium]|nr:hypothetical protein [Pirellulales bacterium]
MPYDLNVVAVHEPPPAGNHSASGDGDGCPKCRNGKGASKKGGCRGGMVPS